MNIVIVGGSGRLGLWYARRFSATGHEVTITGRNRQKLDQAAAVTKVVTSTDSEAAMKSADIIVVSTPIGATPAMIETAGRVAPSGALLCDLASVKSGVLQVYNKLQRPDLELASLHPLHGPRVSTLQDITILSVPLRVGARYGQLCRMLVAEGAHVVPVDGARHDQDMAVLQGLTHFVAIATASTLKALPPPQFETPAYALLRMAISRVLLQDPQLYAAIQLENSQNVAVRKAFLEHAERLSGMAERGDMAALHAEIEQGTTVFGDAERELAATDACLSVLASCKHEPESCRVATLGPPGTFSDVAARQYGQITGIRINPYYCATIADVYDAVKHREVSLGMVPVENMIDGTIVVSLDRLFDTGLHVCAEVLVPVHHALSATVGTSLRDVKRVLSIPPILAQTRSWLRANLPQAKLVETNSSAEAIDQVARTRIVGDAAIGLAATAEAAGLSVLARDIEDEKGNVTRFFVVGEQDAACTGYDRTSLCVHEVPNKPGVLDHILHVIAKHGLNLSKAESRPTRKRLGDYQFYIDVEGHREDERLQSAIAELRGECLVTVLGSYPRAF